VNAHATALQPATPRIEIAPRSEHISIEAEPEAALAPSRPPHRAVRSTFRLGSKLRGCRTEISILADHYLAVKSERPKATMKKYVLDLRFVDARPVRVRHVAWNWLAVAIVLFLATAAAMWWTATSAGGALATPLLVTVSCAVATGIAVFSFLRRTTESLDFISVHGGATLVSILGGIGSAKTGKRFFVEMIKSINAAKLGRPQPKPQWLRDEMREHHRLRELKVLSEEEYATSKSRILAAHS
jgi:hypothetical protein